MTKFKKIKPLDDGWSDWEAPIQGYKMACCDCALVHDMEFKVVKVAERDGADFSGDEVPFEDYRVLIRARRNNRSTGQLRRHSP